MIRGNNDPCPRDVKGIAFDFAIRHAASLYPDMVDMAVPIRVVSIATSPVFPVCGPDKCDVGQMRWACESFRSSFL